MTINKRAVIEYVLLLLIIVLFLLILPGLAAAAGSVLLIYIDGIQDFSPVASRLAFAAVGMMVVSLIGAKILKAERSFLKVPVILTLTGIVLIPEVVNKNWNTSLASWPTGSGSCCVGKATLSSPVLWQTSWPE